MKPDTILLTRLAVFGGYTAVFQCPQCQLPIEAYMATGKGLTRELAMRDLFAQIPSDVVRRSLMPFRVVNSDEFHPV